MSARAEHGDQAPQDGSHGTPPVRLAPPGPDRSDRDNRPRDDENTFMGHLMELRARIIVCLVVLGVAMIAAWIFYEPIVEIIKRPLNDYNATAPEGAKIKLQAIGLTEPFVFVISVGLWAGLLLASPVIAWQIWSFVSPGLYRRERLAILPIFTAGAFCFAGGAYFAYRLTVPMALEFLVPYASRLGASMEPRLKEYFQFFLMIHLAFGFAFEAPLIMLALARMGLVTARGLARRWQYVAVGSFVAGALLTPPDVVTQILMGGSLMVLYFVGIVLALVFGRREAKSGGDDSDGAEPPGEEGSER